MSIKTKTYAGRFLTLSMAALVSTSCGITNTESMVAADDAPYTGNIRVSLAHPFNVQTSDYELLFSSTIDTVGLGVCVAKETPTCTPGGQGFYPADLIFSNGTKNFFKSKSSALLEDGLTLKVVASDKTGKTIDSRNIQFVKSGSTAATTTTPATTTAPSGAVGATTTPATTTIPPTTATTTPPTTTPNNPPTTSPTNQGGGAGGW